MSKFNTNNAFQKAHKPAENKSFIDKHGTILGGGILAFGMVLVGTQYSGGNNFSADLTDEEATTTEVTETPAETTETSTETTEVTETSTETTEVTETSTETTEENITEETEVQTAEATEVAETSTQPTEVVTYNSAPETVDAENSIPVPTALPEIEKIAADIITLSVPSAPKLSDAYIQELKNKAQTVYSANAGIPEGYILNQEPELIPEQ